MPQAERLYKIESLIRHRGCVSFATLLEELEVSRATLKRDLEFLRSRLGAPIVYDRDRNGYVFGPDARGARHELPGLWFSERELYALLMAYQLLHGLDTEGMLARHLAPLVGRIEQLLGSGDGDASAALVRRVRIVAAQRRPVAGEIFERVGEAVVQRRRLRLTYLTRSRGEAGEREVSPQRLVHHRNTWYLDAWCHRADALRRFALDATESATVLEAPAQEVPLRRVQAEMDAGYGIYAGGTRQWARLVFSAQAARWISREEWHPEQQGRRLPDGRWELRLPFVDETELAMDLLRQGDQVEVMEPPSLRAALHRRLRAALAIYEAAG